MSRIPDERTILRFCHVPEERQIAQQMLALVNASLSDLGLSLNNGSVIDATLIAVPASTKNSSGKRDPGMHQTIEQAQIIDIPNPGTIDPEQ